MLPHFCASLHKLYHASVNIGQHTSRWKWDTCPKRCWFCVGHCLCLIALWEPNLLICFSLMCTDIQIVNNKLLLPSLTSTVQCCTDSCGGDILSPLGAWYLNAWKTLIWLSAIWKHNSLPRNCYKWHLFPLRGLLLYICEAAMWTSEFGSALLCKTYILPDWSRLYIMGLLQQPYGSLSLFFLLLQGTESATTILWAHVTTNTSNVTLLVPV